MADKEMIERVAKAILETPNASDYERLVAINAIKAMREPTDKMLKAEGVFPSCHMCGGHKEGWQATIDAVIND
jgi:hypothetical protein